MAFPTLSAFLSTGNVAATTSHTGVTGFNNLSAKPHIIAIWIWDSSTATVTAIPSGWTSLTPLYQVGGHRMGVYWHLSEGSSENNVAAGPWTTSASVTGRALFFLVTGMREISVTPTWVNNGTSAPNPPSLTHGWGATEEVLWLAGFTCKHSGATTGNPTSAAPTNYTMGSQRNYPGTGDPTGYGVAYRSLVAASEDPGAFTATAGLTRVSMHAFTIAIRPVAPIPVKLGDYRRRRS